MKPLRIGTRGSPLALAQAREVRARLAAAHPDLAGEAATEIVVITTTGDRDRSRPLSEIGGKGLFTKEIEEALIAEEIDLAVHSMKDVPTWLPEGLEISTILPREDPRDALFAKAGNSLADLPQGAVVGTVSLRRQAQILAARPDLKVVPIRGNVDTRLRKLAEGEVDATLLAVAGLRRLGQAEKITAAIETEEMLPAVAQGAIGLEIRSADDATRARVLPLNDADSAVRVSAERACLEVLDGSCRTPIAAFAELVAPDRLRLRALVAEPDGSRVFASESSGSPDTAATLGQELGQALRREAGEDFFKALGHL